MQAEDVAEILRAQPFRAFRLHMSDGKTFDIRHPELVLLFRWKMIIGLPDEDPDEILERAAHCSLSHVGRLEELEAGTPR